MKSKYFLGLFIALAFSCQNEIKVLTVEGVNDQVLSNANMYEGDWLTYGKNYSEDRFSSLNQITKENISDLGLAWHINLGTKRGIEATPVVVDGIMFLTGPWSVVYAIDVREGEILWTYDPKVPKETGELACCDVVNRGVSIYKGSVFVGTLDGRLISLDSKKGSVNWTVDTIEGFRDEWSYTITGAPRVFDGKVLIGNGGAEYGVRGFFTAYDAMTGAKIWRFYTVPGDPKKPFESEAMKKAVETWNGEWWKYGGGGTTWDSFAYDPELELVYVGTGNGSPWHQEIRSPGGGDNLYLCSILAVDVKTGKLKWHYQTTPGDTWDYTSVQQIILADLKINNKQEKVLMQAPKNGFFYVLNRENGKLLSADPFVYVNWAKSVDLETGRPIETLGARHKDINKEIFPGPWGGHNWQAMAFNPNKNLVFIPSRELSFIYGRDENFETNTIQYVEGPENTKIQTFKFDKKQWNTGTAGLPGSPENNRMTSLDSVASAIELKNGKLIAWDPVQKKEVWSYDHETPWNSGVLSTDDLVFQGDPKGLFRAHDINTGSVIWEYDLKSGIIAPPITYMVDGIQYITIAAGWGGSYGLYNRHTPSLKPGTIYTFALNEQNQIPNYPDVEKLTLLNLENTLSQREIDNGGKLFARYCQQCHRLQKNDFGGYPGGGNIPDLTYSKASIFDMFDNIVLDGVFLQKGMPSFGDRLNKEQTNKIKEYIISMANKSKS